MSRFRDKRKPALIEPNLTSLIDVTFLLIVFFVLVSHFNEVSSVDMNLPTPIDPATVLPEAENQVAVSVVPNADGTAAGYRIGDTTYPADKSGMELLTGHLASLYRTNPKTNVNVRADRSTRYEAVEPVMQAVSAAAKHGRDESGSAVMPRVNLMVLKDS